MASLIFSSRRAANGLILYFRVAVLGELWSLFIASGPGGARIPFQ